MKMKKRFLVLFLALAGMPIAQAADSSDGCGIASQVYPDKTMVGITVRYTTRGVYSQTLDWTGTTMGKFGCAKHSIVKNEVRDIHYLNSNIDSIMIDAAQGRGEYLTGLSRSLGCGDAAVGELSREMQNNFEKVFFPRQQNERETPNKIRSIIKSNERLVNNCVQIS